MVNLKYPSGLKSKATMGWLGAFAFGFSPLFFFWDGVMSQEYLHGNNIRTLSSEHPHFMNWVASDYKTCITHRHLLDFNPNFPMSDLDKKVSRYSALEFSQKTVI